ncbi:MAG: hypothetical protein MUC39_02550 [Candidatus Omnitrophica bacterium]|nr:hypothetical protein [Candidatus Omnitrophota bacterium]
MMGKMGYLFAIAPAAIFLAISFFVMLAANKADAKGLKTFGIVIAVMLWLSAAFVLTAGITGRCPMMKAMKNCMMDKDMMRQGAPMIMPEKK